MGIRIATCHSTMFYFLKKSYERLTQSWRAFLERVGPRILSDRLKALITLEQVNTSVKTSMVRL